MAKLTPRQQKFADEYIITTNATQSAIKAGYSKKYANTNASKLLHNTTISKYIDERLQKHQEKLVATQEEVLKFLSESMFGEIEEEVVVTLGTGDGTSEVAKTTKQLSAKDRIKAAELLGKRYKLFTDKQEIEHTGAVQFVDDIEDDFDDTD